MTVLLVGGLGYIGSVLSEALPRAGIGLHRCDGGDNALGELGADLDYPCRYQELSRADLKGYSDVLWFAGHSSVGKSVSDPVGCIRNNCLDLFEFATRLSPGCRLIYASSASLYSTSSNREAPVPLSAEGANISPSNNEYDVSKFAFDYIAGTFLQGTVGLRMGTVSGWSPRLREDLVFNAMNLSALRENIVRVSNPQCYRSLFFLTDLTALITRLLTAHQGFAGLINGSSFSGTIADIGAGVAKYHGATLSVEDDTVGPYSFRLDDTLMRGLIGDVEQSPLSVHCERFSRLLRTEGRDR